MEWIIQVPILFFSVIAHEFAHGYVAFRRGDDTAYLSGRLTFNPVSHIDFFGTIVLPVLCYFTKLPMFGWAKPVPVNPFRMANPAKDMVKVAAAGPLANILLALAGALAYRFAAPFTSLDPHSLSFIFLQAARYVVIINLGLAVFNLVPVAPLDGSQILGGLLPRRWAEIYARHAPYGMWIMLGLILTGLIRFILVPPLVLLLMLMGIPLF